MEDNINFTVKVSLSNKMVVGWVVQGESREGETGTEVREKIKSVDIVGVGVGIAADKVRGFWIFGL